MDQITSIAYLPGEDILQVEWDLHSYCNFSCSYCNTRFHDGKSIGVWNNPNLILDFHTRLSSLTDKPISYQFLGGEPSLTPEFIDICKQLKAVEVPPVISVVSNGSANISWWLKIQDYIDNLFISVHIEETNFQHNYNLVASIKETLPVQFINVISNESLEMVNFLDDVMALNKPNVTLLIKELDDRNGHTDISAELIELTAQMTLRTSEYNNSRDKSLFKISRSVIINDDEETTCSEIKQAGRNHFKGMSCYIGIDYLRISAAGEIMTADCPSDTALIIGSVYDINAFNLLSVPLKCTTMRCSCEPAIKVRKHV